MTFHVRYNDCHLEADMERERAREIEQQRRGVKRRGGRGRRREKGGQSVDENGLGHLWFLTRRLKPTSFLMNLPHLGLFLPSPVLLTQTFNLFSLSPSFLPLVSIHLPSTEA